VNSPQTVVEAYRTEVGEKPFWIAELEMDSER
jgi:hypothetical protein